MAAPAAVRAVIIVLKDPKLRKILGGIILGIIIIIMAPIALLLSIGGFGGSGEWDRAEIQQYVYDKMTDEAMAQLQRFGDIMQAIEDEITVQGVDVEPIKAQVIFLCVLVDREDVDAIYGDFVSCFAENTDDEAVFASLTDRFGVDFTAEEKEKILLLCEKAVESKIDPSGVLQKKTGVTTLLRTEYIIDGQSDNPKKYLGVMLS